VIEMELVLLARIAPAGAIRSRSANSRNLRSVFSVAASITTVAFPTAPRSVLVAIRPNAACRSSADRAFFFT